MIKDIAEPMFGVMLPAPLNTLHFTKIDLGHIPMTFANVDVHKTENNGIKVDLDLNWDGACDIELDGSMIPKIGVEHVKLKGRLSLLLCPLTNIIPLIGAVQVAFIDPPSLELVFTDGAHIANLGVIDRAIRKVILSIISSMAVLPNRFLVKLDPNNDFFKTYQHPLGVLRLTIESGTNFGEESKSKNFLKKLVHDVPDCFVKVNVSAEGEWKTETVKNNRHPEWNEAHDFLITDYHQHIEVDVKDDDTTSDDDMGVARTNVKQLLLDGGRQELSLVHNGESTEKKLNLSGIFFQFVPDATSLSEEGSGTVGLLTVLVASALGIQGNRLQLKPSVKVSWGGQAFRTAIKTDAPGSDIENPSFDQAFKIPLTSGMVPGPPVTITLMDSEEERGSVEVPLEDVFSAPNMALETDFDVGNGATVRAGIWLRGIIRAQ
ncbi:hypothetical protein B0H67DRAFT_392894 [Lasiosphaeris hirsuta]|uniref:Uncharacterized protein n=1 Tax=Lasiosphaeris hirsuta TaxID=260670 RepID=A0AA40DI38_9PEZI|nr:hypothetical protein B0H67DRAFT_392894 [Lasiosphaeris hirsuta]